MGLLEQQVRRLAVRAREAGVTLHHLKLHGALYHAVDRDPRLARTYLNWAAVRCRGVRVYARAGGAVEAESMRAGSEVEVWAEGFLDRGYMSDGRLIPREDPGALLDGIPQVLERLADLRDRGGCRAVDGTWVAMNPRTLCVHGDALHALEWLEAVRVVMPRPPHAA